jgi:DeoR/GlpR family transcriptional regulator of sugar metabolism
VSGNDRVNVLRGLVPEQRRQRIVERLRGEGSVSVAALEADFGVSSMTARRDLQILERAGAVRRTHGGAVLPGLARDESVFARRLEQAAEAKARLGRAACELVRERESVFVDCSTTALHAVRELLHAGRRLTILTPSVAVMDLVARAEDPQVELIGLSGSLRRVSRSFVGPETIRAASGHFTDKLLFSVRGIAPGAVLTEADPLEAEVKRAMLARAREAVLLVDGSKFEHAGLSAIAPASVVSAALVADAAPAHVRTLADAGVRTTEVP